MNIEFPQPDIIAPRIGTSYYYIYYDYFAVFTWNNDDVDNENLASGRIYLSNCSAEQRLKYNKEHFERLIQPQWFRDLDDTFMYLGKKISKVDFRCKNFKALEKSNFENIKKPIVRIVGDKTFTWPALSEGAGWYVSDGKIWSCTQGHSAHKRLEDAITELEHDQAVIIKRLRDISK